MRAPLIQSQGTARAFSERENVRGKIGYATRFFPNRAPLPESGYAADLRRIWETSIANSMRLEELTNKAAPIGREA